MRWFWEWKHEAEHFRALHDDAMRRLHEQSGHIAELRNALDKAEKERREAQLQILRVLYGLPIFQDETKTKPEEKQQSTVSQEPLPVLDFAAMPEADINAVLVGEARKAGCATMSQIIAYVNRRKSELWGQQNPDFTAQEYELKKQAIEKIESAIMEGRSSWTA
jgi:hypothetical protein